MSPRLGPGRRGPHAEFHLQRFTGFSGGPSGRNPLLADRRGRPNGQLPSGEAAAPSLAREAPTRTVMRQRTQDGARRETAARVVGTVTRTLSVPGTGVSSASRTVSGSVWESRVYVPPWGEGPTDVHEHVSTGLILEAQRWNPPKCPSTEEGWTTTCSSWGIPHSNDDG